MGILLTDNGLLVKGRAMASVLVAGRVSEECKERADYYIRRAGLTASEVIRIVWENIARTGEVPHAIEPNPNEDAELEDSPLMRRYYELRASTPRCEFLENLTPEGLKEELSNRDL